MECRQGEGDLTRRSNWHGTHDTGRMTRGIWCHSSAIRTQHSRTSRARGRWIGEGSSDPAWNHWKFRSSELALLRRTVAERCEGPLVGRVDQQRAGGGDFSSPANSLGARTKRDEATAGSMVGGANESIFRCGAERSSIARAESYGVLHAWSSKRFRKCSSAPNCRADDLVGDRSSRNDSSRWIEVRDPR